ncbi:MarR family transcriptional regulator [Pseudogracilibacillus sp. SE30717A]|uniref:MarR family winged helix-turn-helix transcriptional regulator n=1 Tax=Pseudogracilibacillus sp. SE30717A TaxID=3098293 RepID=UPI00300E259D
MSSDQQHLINDFEKSFWNLRRKMKYMWEEIYEQKFPGSQSHILYMLGKNGPKKMSELANSLYLTPGAVTTASDHLISNGYIARTRNEKDRRVVHLELTQKGKSALKDLQNEGRKRIELVFKDVSDSELKMMNDIFNQAIKNIDNIGR